MVDENLKFTKITFLVHIIIGIIFTILYWIPAIFMPLFGLTYNPLAGMFSQVLGAAGAGLTVSSIFGYMAKEWKEVKIVVITEIVWLACALIAVIINFFVIGLSAILFIILLGLLLVLFLVSFLKQEEIIGKE